MSRSEFVHPLSGGRNFAPKSNNDYAMPFYDQSSMYGYQTMQPNRASQFRPSSQMGERSIDGTSVKSYNAVEGSLRDSMVSFNSGFSGPSRKSQKSIMSNYPQMLNKQIQKPQNISNMEVMPNQQKKSTNQTKIIQQNIPKKKANYYIDEDYYYSSEFKRNFVKGMLAIAKNKQIQDLSLLLREVAPTIMIRSVDTSIWVAAFLIIFKIQHKIRRTRGNQEDIIELIQDYLVDYMLTNKQIKKARLIKIVIYIFKQLPIHKPKVIPWFEDFVRKNKDRLFGIDISKYVDVYSIVPCPIDYDNLNKSNNIKAKQVQKEKEKEKDKRKQLQPEKLQIKQKSDIKEKQKQIQKRQKQKQTQFEKQRQEYMQIKQDRDQFQNKSRYSEKKSLNQKSNNNNQRKDIALSMKQKNNFVQKFLDDKKSQISLAKSSINIKDQISNKSKLPIQNPIQPQAQHQHQHQLQNQNKTQNQNQIQNQIQYQNQSQSQGQGQNQGQGTRQSHPKQSLSKTIVNKRQIQQQKKDDQKVMSLQEMISLRIQSATVSNSIFTSKDKNIKPLNKKQTQINQNYSSVGQNKQQPIRRQQTNKQEESSTNSFNKKQNKQGDIQASQVKYPQLTQKKTLKQRIKKLAQDRHQQLSTLKPQQSSLQQNIDQQDLRNYEKEKINDHRNRNNIQSLDQNQEEKQQSYQSFVAVSDQQNE